MGETSSDRGGPERAVVFQGRFTKALLTQLPIRPRFRPIPSAALLIHSGPLRDVSCGLITAHLNPNQAAEARGFFGVESVGLGVLVS